MREAVTTLVRPFPFASLERVSRESVAAATRVKRRARAIVDVEAIARALSDLVGEPVSVSIRSFAPIDPARGADDAIGVVLAPADRAHDRVLVEVEGALGAALVTRALKQRAPRITDPSRGPAPAVAGALAAVVHAAARRAHAGVAMKVVAAGPGSALARDFARELGQGQTATTAWLTVTLGADAFSARASVADAIDPGAPPLTPESLARMADAAIALPLVVATTLASRDDLAALAIGDALAPTGFRLRADESGALAGPASLVAPRSERGLAADLAEGGRLVVRGELETHPWSPPMADATTTIEVLDDAPVVVRVELGTVEMKAREWAELGPGDVVPLGRKLGEPAILRVGGVELARGELVQVDGEYAVRISSR
ncbi:MAG: FliM/FliN family flagellar motor switch protein [Labilithrix sp.]|nr:FliM/FliN family flagellar motor switch protein [Labilithrix sp.]